MQKKLLITLIGTHGSGKTVVMAELMKQMFYKETIIGDHITESVGEYKVKTTVSSLYIAYGTYKDGVCGGADTVGNVKGVLEHIQKWRETKKVILLEGVLFISDPVFEAYANSGREVVAIYLDTPLHVIEKRLYMRSPNAKIGKGYKAKHEQYGRRFDSFREKYPTIRFDTVNTEIWKPKQIATYIYNTYIEPQLFPKEGKSQIGV